MEIGQSLLSSVNGATCIAINNQFYQHAPYLYVFRGQNGAIQRLNIDNSNSDNYIDNILDREWEMAHGTGLNVSSINCETDWSSVSRSDFYF